MKPTLLRIAYQKTLGVRLLLHWVRQTRWSVLAQASGCILFNRRPHHLVWYHLNRKSCLVQIQVLDLRLSITSPLLMYPLPTIHVFGSWKGTCPYLAMISSWLCLSLLKTVILTMTSPLAHQPAHLLKIGVPSQQIWSRLIWLSAKMKVWLSSKLQSLSMLKLSSCLLPLLPSTSDSLHVHGGRTWFQDSSNISVYPKKRRCLSR